MLSWKEARLIRRETRELQRLICVCRDLPDILKFARVAARSPAPAVCFYGSDGASYDAAEGDFVMEMGLVSAEQAMLEAEFASVVCADLSLACTVDVNPGAEVAWAGPGATFDHLVRSCREHQLMPCFGSGVSDDALPDRLLSMVIRDPTGLSRFQKISLGGHIHWMDTYKEKRILELLSDGSANLGIISRIEVLLRPCPA